MRRLRAVALVTALLGIGLAGPSNASTYYDYWGYWHKPPGATAWEYSKVGPSGYYLQPDQPQVEGWRYAIGTASQSDPKPRPVDVVYDDYCKGKNASATYRVLLVVDYGTQSGAPAGPVYSCYGFNDAKTGSDVLTQQHTERDSGGLICAIDRYPKSGCGDVVSSPAPKATPTHASTPTPSSTRSVSAARMVTTPTPRRTATPTRSTATATPTTSPSTPDGSPSIVAQQFLVPHRRGGVPYGFVAACGFVAAMIGAVVWQRRRRAR